MIPHFIESFHYLVCVYGGCFSAWWWKLLSTSQASYSSLIGSAIIVLFRYYRQQLHYRIAEKVAGVVKQYHRIKEAARSTRRKLIESTSTERGSYDESLNIRRSASYESEHSGSCCYEDHIKLLTYNIFLRPPLVKNNDDDFKNERLKLFLEQELENYDIVCLQEMFSLGTTRQSRLIKEAEARGFHYHVVGAPTPLLSLKLADAGVVILSRYPIIRAAAHMYQHGVQIDGWVGKQVIYACVQLPTTSGNDDNDNDYADDNIVHRAETHPPVLHLFTTHTQASYLDNSENKSNDMHRMGQIREVRQFIHRQLIQYHSENRHCDNCKCLLMGDLNVDARPAAGSDAVHTDEYLEMMSILSEDYPISNPLFDSYGYHPVTYGDVDRPSDCACPVQMNCTCTNALPVDKLLTHTADLGVQMCLDYVLQFHYHPPSVLQQQQQQKVVTASVQPFRTRQHPYILSDHYGVSSQLLLV